MYVHNFRKLFVVIRPDTKNVNKSLSMFSLPTNGSNIKKVIEYDLRGIHGEVAVDIHNQLIYVVQITELNNNNYRLVRFNYAGANRTVLYQSTSLFPTCGLDVFNGSIVWYNKQTTTINICKPNPTCEENNTKTFNGSFKVST